MIEYLILGSLISWGVNVLLAPPPQEPICYYTEDYQGGKMSTPILCKEKK